jgi:FtsP/CotA-like multicopper oxidase with cupredoxin domain
VDPGGLDRRELLAAGGAAFICTLAGQRLSADKPADLSKLAGGVAVPPRVADAASSNGSRTTLASATASADGGRRREYWIAAETRRWNIVPRGRDQMMGRRVEGKTKFTAYAYRRYSAGFEAPMGKAAIPGPLIEANVGDTVVVHYRNEVKVPTTIHPHGIFYPEEMDGAYKGRYTDPGGFVQRGQEFTYVWEARPGTEGLWLYHDHGPLDPIPVFKGMFGPLIIRDPTKPRPDAEHFLFMHALQPVATRLRRNFWCINGRAYAGNAPTVRSKVGQRVAFHVISLDNFFHTFHIHGHRWRDPDGTVIDTKTMGPGESFSFEFDEDNPGRWLYHCHVFSHLHEGMTGWYIVS